MLLRECNRLQKQAFCFSDIFIRAQRNCTSRAKDFRCPPMLRTLVVRIDLPHPVQSITVALRIDGGLNEFGSECRVEYAVLTVLKQFETFADEHRRVVILPPFGLAQPQYAKTDPLIASGRMGSGMLSKFERVINSSPARMLGLTIPACPRTPPRRPSSNFIAPRPDTLPRLPLTRIS